MRRRLSFLDQQASEPSWSLPFISTVTGRLETRVDADYFVQNLRKPVLFRKVGGGAGGGRMLDVVGASCVIDFMTTMRLLLMVVIVVCL